MDAETLERLLMDRALGTLSRDVEALLDAWLEQNPAARDRAAEFATAAATARRALRSELPTTLPPLPPVRLARIAEARRRVIWVRNAAGLAAALVIGVGLGALLMRGPATHPREPGAMQAIQRLAAAEEPRTAPGGFWSAARLAHSARDTQRTEQRHWNWESPARRPKLGGDS